MALHNDLGSYGEELAGKWLAGRGFLILDKHWRSGRNEIDFIAMRQKVYHFIEVKYRQTKEFGYPEERVSKRKLERIMNAASHWLYLHQIFAQTRIQLDVLSILDIKGQEIEFVLFEDVSL